MLPLTMEILWDLVCGIHPDLALLMACRHVCVTIQDVVCIRQGHISTSTIIIIVVVMMMMMMTMTLLQYNSYSVLPDWISIKVFSVYVLCEIIFFTAG